MHRHAINRLRYRNLVGAAAWTRAWVRDACVKKEPNLVRFQTRDKQVAKGHGRSRFVPSTPAFLGTEHSAISQISVLGTWVCAAQGGKIRKIVSVEAKQAVGWATKKQSAPRVPQVLA